MRSDNILIMGTGTDVGKTFVSAKLISLLKDRGENVGYFKPVASGGISDAEYVHDHTYLKDLDFITPSDLTGVALDSPCSPHLAFKLEGRSFSPEDINKKFTKLDELFSLLVIEGCGGLFCPIYIDSDASDTKKRAILQKDIIKLFSGKIFLVTSSGLGSINDTVLTLDYARNHDIEISAVIMNGYDEKNPVHLENRNFISSWSDIPVINLQDIVLYI